MMEWQQLKNNVSMATVKSGDSIEQAMIELCQHIKSRVIPSNAGIDWDYLRVEFWPDSGRVIVFPSSSSNSDRIETAGCQVVFGTLLVEYERLADSDLDDNAFVDALLQEERMWIERFLDSARKTGLSGNHIQFWDGERCISDAQI
ncbi:MAG: hypothetical protein V4719_25650 [Planctomycetota bacterium]